MDPVHVDYAVAAVLLIAVELSAATASDERARWVTAAIGPPIALAVANRRRWTLQALGLAGVTVAAKQLLAGTQHGGANGLFGPVALLLLFYAAGAFLDGRRAWLGFALTTALGAAVSFKGSSLLLGLFSVVAFVWMPWLVGRSRRLSGTRERAARELAERLDADRELHVRAAALSERMRLAREIHDVITHSVSVMVIQAAGARTVMDRAPARAEVSLRSVERAGREALAEMRRLLGVLGNSEDLRALAPQPGLDDLPELVSSTRTAGLDTSIRVEGEPVAVSQGLSLCVYRVVQEALTNALKHAGADPSRGQRSLERGRVGARSDRAGGHRPSRSRARRDMGSPGCASAPRFTEEPSTPALQPAAASPFTRGFRCLRGARREHGDRCPSLVGRPDQPSRTSMWWSPQRLMVDLIVESALGAGIPHRLATALFAVQFAAPIAVRRRWPAAAVVCAAGACLLQDAPRPAVQPAERERRARADAVQLRRGCLARPSTQHRSRL